MIINAGQFLTRRAILSPDKPGLVCEGQSYTFYELNKRANRLANMMDSLGLRPGDRVAVLAKNGVEYYDLFFGLGKNGGILVPLNFRLCAAELIKIIDDAGPRVLVYGPEFKDLAEEIIEAGPPLRAICTKGEEGPHGSYDDLMAKSKDFEPLIEAGGTDELAIIYAGWSAQNPRGVLLTHYNFFWEASTMTSTLTRLGKRFLLALPFFHIGALGWLPFFMHRGICCVLMPGFEADGFLNLIKTESITSFGAIPAMLYLLKESPNFKDCNFSNVTNILAYGDAVPVELIKEYASYDIRIRQLYGLTESTGPVLVMDGDYSMEKAGSCGLPFFYTRVKLVNDIGLEVPVGQVGEIIIEAGHVMKGYWNQPEATANALREGWLYTGDLARQDADGFFYITDRKKELIISGGENIYPTEVESIMHDHPDVIDVAVLGAPEKIWGETVKAYVMKSPGSTLTQDILQNWMNNKIASFKIPKEIQFVDDLPRTLTGKMEKRKLRDS